jgi:hypothetical protein
MDLEKMIVPPCVQVSAESSTQEVLKLIYVREETRWQYNKLCLLNKLMSPCNHTSIGNGSLEVALVIPAEKSMIIIVSAAEIYQIVTIEGQGNNLWRYPSLCEM